MNNNLTDQFIDSIYSLFKTKLPKEIEDQAKMCLLDYYGCTYLGSYLASDKITEYLNIINNDIGYSVIVGIEQKTSMQHAAFINGIMAHIAELDDGHRYGMMHPGAPVISAVLAFAQSVGLSFDQVLLGIVAGYEVAIRIASAIQPGHKLKGYHATGTCGTIGAALGISVACNYSKKEIKTVLSAAVSDAAGLLTLMDNVSAMKPYNCGRAAVAGINAALIGRMSFNGPDDALGGERGFFKVMAETINFDYLFNGIQNKYAIETIYRKPYAACRHCHAAIEAMLWLQNEYHFIPKDIRHITVKTYDTAIKGHDHVHVVSSSSAKMSIPYSVAAAMVFEKAGYEQFIESNIKYIKNSNILNKISIEEDTLMSSMVPQKRCSEVTVETSTDIFSKLVEYPKGEPENPINLDELKDKFISLMKASHADYKKITEIKEMLFENDNCL